MREGEQRWVLVVRQKENSQLLVFTMCNWQNCVISLLYLPTVFELKARELVLYFGFSLTARDIFFLIWLIVVAMLVLVRDT